jgi:hypothetical protein
MKITIPISVGELLDKISILEIKSMFTDNEYVLKELEELNLIKNTLTQYTLEYEVQLKKVNELIWKIEDKLRQLEKEQRFDDEFIELARAVYFTNDKRAEVKKGINIKYGSLFVEEKSYSDYQ